MVSLLVADVGMRRLKSYTVVASHKRLNKTFDYGSEGRRKHLSDMILLFYQKFLYLCTQGVKTWLGRGIKSKYKALSSAPAKAIPPRFLGQITQAVSVEAALFLKLSYSTVPTPTQSYLMIFPNWELIHILFLHIAYQ